MNTPIEQKTPYRVLHRRSDIIRTKNISNIELLYLDNKVKEMKLTIKCDGGLYIKELISGDNGRTIPNLSLLLSSNCHVEELDVIDIGEISKI